MSADVVHARGQGLRGLLVELSLVGVAVLLNLLVRWYTLDELERARGNATDVLDLEVALGLDWERAVQDHALTHGWLAGAADWFYVWGYFPIVLAALVWLYLRRPPTYAFLRNALLASGAVGLLFYAFYPCAPPRLSGLGYTDTVAGGRLDGAARPSGLANELAAMPSFHLAWLVVVSVVLFGTYRSTLLRVLAVLHPVLMAYAVVATANHWVLDVPAGAALAVAGLLVAYLLRRRPAPRGLPALPEPVGTAGR